MATSAAAALLQIEVAALAWRPVHRLRTDGVGPFGQAKIRVLVTGWQNHCFRRILLNVSIQGSRQISFRGGFKRDMHPFAIFLSDGF